MARNGGANNFPIMIISDSNRMVSPKFLTRRTSTPNTLLERFISSVASDANVGNREQKRYKCEECDNGNDLRFVRFPCQVPWVIAAKTPSFMSLHPTLGSLVYCTEAFNRSR
jgi:hypothetical protein